MITALWPMRKWYTYGGIRSIYGSSWIGKITSNWHCFDVEMNRQNHPTDAFVYWTVTELYGLSQDFIFMLLFDRNHASLTLIWEYSSHLTVRLLKQQARQTMKPGWVQRFLSKGLPCAVRRSKTWEFTEFFTLTHNSPLQLSSPSPGRRTKEDECLCSPVYIEHWAGRAHQGVRWL